MFKIKSILSYLLVLSLILNAHLFLKSSAWEEAWQEQIFTTSIIEKILKRSGADVSFEAMQSLAKDEFGDVKLLPLEETDNIWVEADSKVISISKTKLFFKDDKYLGSKANLPNQINSWL